MKAAPRNTRSNRPEPSFFEHVFYWMWEFSPKNGLPDRNWMVVALAQSAYLLFPIALCMQFFSDDTVRALYEADGNLTILPIMGALAIIVWRNMLFYDKKKYQEIKEYYMQVSPAARIRRKRQCLLFLAITVIVILVEAWLFNLYYDRCLSYKYRPFIEIRRE